MTGISILEILHHIKILETKNNKIIYPNIAFEKRQFLVVKVLYFHYLQKNSKTGNENMSYPQAQSSFFSACTSSYSLPSSGSLYPSKEPVFLEQSYLNNLLVDLYDIKMVEFVNN